MERLPEVFTEQLHNAPVRFCIFYNPDENSSSSKSGAMVNGNMENLVFAFLNAMNHYPEIENIIRSVLIVKDDKSVSSKTIREGFAILKEHQKKIL